MLAREVSASALAVALHAANVERDRLRKRRLMLTDALVPVLPGLSCPVHGIWGAQDVLYRHRLPLIGQVLARSLGFVSLDLLPQAIGCSSRRQRRSTPHWPRRWRPSPATRE